MEPKSGGTAIAPALMPSGNLDMTPQNSIGAAAMSTAAAGSAGISIFGMLMGSLSTIGNSMIDLLKKRCAAWSRLAGPAELIFRVVAWG